jgi:peptide/nickel transport system substrate-binding protein
VPVEQVGKYGGRITGFATAQTAWNDLMLGGETAGLFLYPREGGLKMVPNLAKGYEISADRTTLTIFLREGAKWSDGAPFTAEDIRFIYEDMHWAQARGLARVITWNAAGAFRSLEVVDPYTIKLIAPSGMGALAVDMATWVGGRINSYHPAHYLKQFHIRYNPEVEKTAKEGGFENWSAYMYQKYWWGTGPYVELPDMTPWVLAEKTPTAYLMKRNPYYWAVDTAGNQLPYFDEMLVSVVNAESYQLKIAAGEADLAYTNVSLPNMPIYRQNERSGNYTTILWPGTRVADFGLNFNQFNADEYKAKLSADIKFRQALNLAINRKEINDTLYFGLAKIRQVAPIPSASYYNASWETLFTEFDPARANRLLDELGLNKRDADGFRVRADNGQTLSWVIEYDNAAVTPGMELVREYFEDVGIKTSISVQDPAILNRRYNQNLTDMLYYINAPDGSELRWHRMWNNNFTRQWWNWLADTALLLQIEYGEKPLPPNWTDLDPKPETEKTAGWERSGVVPPQWYKDWYLLQQKFAAAVPGSDEYKQLAPQVYKTRVETLQDIGIVGMAPQPVIVKNTLGNHPKPETYIPGYAYGSPLVSHFIDQLYRK